jgi:tetratricopeptide (TPR) repeat protein
MLRDLATRHGYNLNDRSGNAMKLEAQTGLKFGEPDSVKDVELTVSHDELASMTGPIEECRGTESLAAASSVHSSEPSNQECLSVVTFTEAPQRYNCSPTFVPPPFSEAKQLFNAFYFGLSAIAIGTVCLTWKLPILSLTAAVFGALAVMAFVFAFYNKAHPADFSVTLSSRTRRLIRTSALLFPLPFFAVVIAMFPAQWQLQEGQKLFHDGKYNEALVHLNLAAVLNPVSEKAFAELADCYNFVWKSDKSLANADKALRLDPLDGDAWASKAWALNAESEYAQALPAALNAVKYSPGSGQANHALAAAYRNLGEYELALPPASKHIRIHFNEPGAFELRADILDRLGRSEEAALDRKQAQALGRRAGE